MVGNCKAVETALNSSSSGTVGDAKDAVPIVDADAGSNSQGNTEEDKDLGWTVDTYLATCTKPLISRTSVSDHKLMVGKKQYLCKKWTRQEIEDMIVLFFLGLLSGVSLWYRSWS